ncbi:nitroreductase family protein [Schnuerera sp. xch1]|uniref:nitroreductase family protein n=1 Tax=Schnuerera sp. xch1 TaxID=2874283 RepID=UPI001CBB3DF2|nr:nitroreductase family protein [Schnuerera sp. xch1]MBZ2174218.1 nitroreductase family protein [Schnuerera sp. xch1]
MDILEAINSRRSIRKFTGEVISDENLKTILKAGFQAPSAHNIQPRDYVVIKDTEIIRKITEFHQYTKMLPKAGCAIAVCGDKEKQSNIGFLVEDCSASIQNMLLTAHGLGLGAVWCGIYSADNLVESMSKLLKLPGHIVPIGMVVVGTKVEDKKPIDRYDETKVHFNRW